MKKELIATSSLLAAILLVSALPVLAEEKESTRSIRKDCYESNEPNKIVRGCQVAKFWIGPDYGGFIHARVDFVIANALAARGDYDPAIWTYDHIISSLRYYLPLTNRGLTYAQKGEYARAIQDFNEAVKIRPDIAIAFIGRGLSYAENEELDLAIRDFDRAIELDSNNALVFYSRGLSYAAKGQNEPADRDFQEAIRLNPAYAKDFGHPGRPYSKNKKDGKPTPVEIKNYMSEFDQCFKATDQDTVIHSCSLAIESWPRYRRTDAQLSELYHERGRAYADEGHHDRAIHDYDQAVSINEAGLINVLYVATFNDRGLSYAAEGKYDLAIKDFDKYMSLTTYSPEQLINRGNAYAGKGEYEPAVKDYDRAIRQLDERIERYPNEAEAYVDRGNAYAGKREYERAFQDFDRAIALAPSYSKAFYSRGSAYHKRCDYSHAIQDYDQVLRLNPKLTSALQDRDLAAQNLGGDPALCKLAEK